MNILQEKNLLKLDITEGTGIFSEVPVLECVEHPTLLLGIGGLGCRTVNGLKEKMKRRFNLADGHLRFLAIDSSVSDLKTMDSLDEDEKLLVFDEAVLELKADEELYPEYVKKWKTPGYLPRLEGDGCLGVRQNGRILLSIPEVYEKVREKLKDKLANIGEGNFSPQSRLNIIFVTGISGGTGSGMFIDLAYLVQDILINEAPMISRSSFRMHAYLYMPDVFAGKGISDNWLKRNGYAALKELDYFYNLTKSGGEYKWPFYEGEVKNSKHKVFDCCTLLSPKCAIYDKKKYVMSTVSEAVDVLLSILTKKGSNVDVYEASLYNINTVTQNWMNILGADTKSFPRSVNYKYNIIQYGSAKIPVEEIMMYMAKKVFDVLFAEYRDMQALSGNYISGIMKDAGLSDVYSVAAELKNKVNKPSVGSDEALPVGITGLKGSFKDWMEKTFNDYQSLGYSESCKEETVAKLKQIVEVISRKLDEVFGTFGPFFARMAVTATAENDGFDGIMVLLKSLQKDLYNRCNGQQKEFLSREELFEELGKEADSLPKLFGREKAENFLKKAKQEIEKNTVERAVFEHISEGIFEVYSQVEEKLKTYNTFIDVLSRVKEIVDKNAMYVSGQTETGGYLLDLSDETENGKRLKACIDSYLTHEKLKAFKNTLKSEIKSSANREQFLDEGELFDAAGVIQRTFDAMFAEYYAQATERFLVVYYRNLGEDYAERLEMIMENSELCHSELEKAAEEICQKISGKSKLMCDVQMSDYFPVLLRTVTVPESVRQGFESAVSVYFNPRPVLLANEGTRLVEMLRVYTGVPLTALKKLNEYDREYDIAIQNNIVGIHIDEGKDSDFRMLPAPFAVEVWEQFSKNHKSVFEQGIIQKIEEDIEFLKKNKLLLANDDAEKSNPRIIGYFEESLNDDILEKLSSSDVSGMEGVSKILSENGVEVKELPIKMISDYGLTDTLGNVRIILRKNPRLLKKVSGFIKQYKCILEALNQ